MEYISPEKMQKYWWLGRNDIQHSGIEIQMDPLIQDKRQYQVIKEKKTKKRKSVGCLRCSNRSEIETLKKQLKRLKNIQNLSENEKIL